MPRKKPTRTKKSESGSRKPIEKQQVPVERSGTMPEIFDSNKYDAMSELTGSATLHGRDVRKTVSHLQKQEGLDPESNEVRLEGERPAVNPTLDEQAE
jgi:hypothetical protein